MYVFMMLYVFLFDTPFQHMSSIGSVSCNNFTVSPRLGDSRDGGEQYLWHWEVHLNQNINAKIRNATEIAMNEQNEMVDLCNPDSLSLKFMHSVLLPSTPSKPSTHHALISIHIYIDIETMYTINTTLNLYPVAWLSYHTGSESLRLWRCSISKWKTCIRISPQSNKHLHSTDFQASTS